MSKPQTKNSKATYFCKDFLWGAATAAHQVEGGNHNQWSVWELENARSLAARAPYQFDDLKNWKDIAKQAIDPGNYVSDRGVEHFSRYQEDFELLKEMGLGAFRFSIEWSRIEPKQGSWDAGAIAHYRAYIKTMKRMGITPVVTLFHFTLPVWFAEMGGFEKRSNVKYFTRFVEKVFEELGSDLGYVITINEPTVYVGESYIAGEFPPNKTGKLKAFWVLQNLIYAHKRVAKLADPKWQLQLSMAHHIADFYAGDDAWLSVLSARVAHYFANGFTISRVMKYSDYLAINYYFSYRIYGYRVHNPESGETDLGWNMQPERLENVLAELGGRYGLPIMVTENGLADADDNQRSRWLSKSIEALIKASDHGVRLIGYLHWSLLDNFEWDKGYWPKFGLIAVDRKTMRRTVRKSGLRYGAVVKKLSK